jgi:hypothetical protein
MTLSSLPTKEWPYFHPEHQVLDAEGSINQFPLTKKHHMGTRLKFFSFLFLIGGGAGDSLVGAGTSTFLV